MESKFESGSSAETWYYFPIDSDWEEWEADCGDETAEGKNLGKGNATSWMALFGLFFKFRYINSDMDANTTAFFSTLDIANYTDVNVWKGLFFLWKNGTFELGTVWLEECALAVMFGTLLFNNY